MEIPAQDDHKTEEFRDFARHNHAGSTDGPAEGEVFLHNIERVANLEAVFNNPYYKMVVDGMSDVEMMRLCAIHLMEKLDFRAAGRLLGQLAHLRSRSMCAPAAAPAETTPLPEAGTARPPAPVYRLDPEAMPLRLPALTEGEQRLRALSDEELARQYRIATKRMLQRQKDR
jgi:hypothetical protein